jgi:hypothetical protein
MVCTHKLMTFVVYIVVLFYIVHEVACVLSARYKPAIHEQNYIVCTSSMLTPIVLTSFLAFPQACVL